MDYNQFLSKKSFNVSFKGLSEYNIHNELFDYQKCLVEWALKKGKCAIFADCGLGKTVMQISWAANVAKYTGKPVLILAPLAVGNQTIDEGLLINEHINWYDCSSKIQILNYDKLHTIDATQFSGVVLDESSILKNFTGKIRNQLIDMFKYTDFKLCCTATPSPNDLMELANHSQFLGVMNREEMLATFFVHDGGETSKWRLKGHAKTDYWQWVSQWAVMLDKPSDIGFSDKGFEKTNLIYHQHIVSVNHKSSGFLFPMQASTLSERQSERRATVEVRVNKAAELVNNNDEPFLLWCDRNDESERLRKAINESVEVKGSDKPEIKASRLHEFSNGNIKRMISKPSIAGFGMNWQHCSNMAFVGLSDSYEQMYQAIRRCWRFGQTKDVNVHVIVAETEGNVLQNIKRKDLQAKEMKLEMLNQMRDFQSNEITTITKNTKEYAPSVSFKKPLF